MIEFVISRVPVLNRLADRIWDEIATRVLAPNPPEESR